MEEDPQKVFENETLMSQAKSEYGSSEGHGRLIDEIGGIDEEFGDVPSKLDDDFPLYTIVAILATAFSYGCVLTTLFLITLPIECERISSGSGTPKSVALGIFVAIAGFTQLISPLIGRISDTYRPPRIGKYLAEIGQRMPYYLLGALLSVFGLIGQMFFSRAALWMRYAFCFFFSMTGLNIQYAMMIALIPDQIPRRQTGVANGILALLLVTGSLFGFGLFHTVLAENIGSMYGLYTCIAVVTSILTATHAHDRDAALTAQRVARTSQTLLHSSDTHSEREESKSWRHKARRVTKRAVRKAKQIVITPAIVFKSMVDPVRYLDDWWTIYTIDTNKYHDFFMVSLSRLFYYCGMSAQTFFLYFLHDILNMRKDPEAAVASLAILSQCSGALTCLPIGLISDRVGGRRKPFVYVACALLAVATGGIMFARDMNDMVYLSLLLGAANGMYLTMDTSLAVDTLPPEGDSESAQLLGIWGVAAFLGSALGPMIGGPLLYLFGSPTITVDGEAEEYSREGYAVVLSLSAFYFLLSAAMLRNIREQCE